MNHQAVIDGALFEPWLWLTPTDVKRLPEVIPTQDRTLFATANGLLFNELQKSPQVICCFLVCYFESTTA